MVQAVTPPVDGYRGRRCSRKIGPDIDTLGGRSGDGGPASDDGSQECDPHANKSGKDAGTDKPGRRSRVETETAESPHARSNSRQVIREKIGVQRIPGCGETATARRARIKPRRLFKRNVPAQSGPDNLSGGIDPGALQLSLLAFQPERRIA